MKVPRPIGREGHGRCGRSMFRRRRTCMKYMNCSSAVSTTKYGYFRRGTPICRVATAPFDFNALIATSRSAT
jgi:hypothetical protein